MAVVILSRFEYDRASMDGFIDNYENSNCVLSPISRRSEMMIENQTDLLQTASQQMLKNKLPQGWAFKPCFPITGLVSLFIKLIECALLFHSDY